MKQFSIILTSVIALFLSSCTVTSNYYQVCEVATEQECVRDSSNFIFEDDNCKIIYSFWTNGGNPGFVLYNKTDKPIYLNKEESYFVRNNFAQDYYKNRIYTNSSAANSISTASTSYFKTNTTTNLTATLLSSSSTASKVVGTSLINGQSVSYEEPKVICIPPMTAKTLVEFVIMESPYRDCDIFRFPREGELSSKEFSAQTSPVKFSNIFTYKVDKDGESINITHNFYISSIENMAENKLIKSEYKTHCGVRSRYTSKVFTNIAAFKFYVKYTKPTSYYKN